MTTAATLPPWMPVARRRIGIREIVGKLHNTTILGWIAALGGAWWRDDETAWCGAFVGIGMKEQGFSVPRHWYRALAWADWGVAVPVGRLVPGTVLVFGRTGGGHVGFYVGEGSVRIGGKAVRAYRVLGGNQGNAVSETWIAASRLVAARWPAGVPIVGKPVQLAASGAVLSVNEA